jgi:hypothetical protein
VIDFKFKFVETSKPIFLVTYSQGYLAVPRKKDGVIFFIGQEKPQITQSPGIKMQETPAKMDEKETVHVDSLRDLLENFKIIYPQIWPNGGSGRQGYLCIDEKIVNKGGLAKHLPVSIHYPDQIP